MVVGSVCEVVLQGRNKSPGFHGPGQYQSSGICQIMTSFSNEGKTRFFLSCVSSLAEQAKVNEIPVLSKQVWKV